MATPRPMPASVPMPADQAALLSAVQEALHERDLYQGLADAAQAHLDAAQADLTGAQTNLAAAQQKLTAAIAALAAA